MMTKSPLAHVAFAALLAAALPLTAAAKGNPAAGKAKSVTCQACHGVDGKAIVKAIVRAEQTPAAPPATSVAAPPRPSPMR